MRSLKRTLEVSNSRLLVIISYFSPRNLVLEIKDAVPNLYYTNPKLNDKKTIIPFKGISKCKLVNDSKFVITSEGTNYIFKVVTFRSLDQAGHHLGEPDSAASLKLHPKQSLKSTEQ